MGNSLDNVSGLPQALESNLWCVTACSLHQFLLACCRRTIAEPPESPLLHRSLTEYNELIPTWINPDGNPVLADIGYGPDADNGIFITGNLTAFREDPEFWNNQSVVQIVSQNEEITRKKDFPLFTMRQRLTYPLCIDILAALLCEPIQLWTFRCT